MRSTIKFTCIIVISCLISSCGGGSSGTVFGGASEEELRDTEAFKSDSPWAGVLKRCISAKSVEQACKLQDLPLLGMENTEPGVSDVMNRVLVSHQWMGERLEELFTTLPTEMLLLTRAITAIVVDDDIRPAYYDSNTGAIYIDPNFLWLTPAEAATVNPKEDFRSGFSRVLNFRSFGRYTKSHQPVYVFRSSTNPVTRSLSDIEYLFAGLLLHELAHANDYFPPAIHSSINRERKPLEEVQRIQNSSAAIQLAQSQPLNSDTMYGLARVMFLGEEANSSQQALTASQVGAEFDPDGAADTYGYSSIREDVAMLFEEVMMYHLFGIERDLAFVTAPRSDTPTCSDYQVQWGSRMRVASGQVNTRAQLVLESLLPELDADLVISNLPETRNMPDGLDWCTSIGFEQNSTSNTNQKPLLLDDMTPIPFYR